MAVTAKVLELWFSQFFLVCLTTRSSLVKVNKETKEFIRLVIENSNRQVICFSSGPVRAIPRGTRVKNAVGDSPSAFLVPDVLLWDPLLHFPELVLLCPTITITYHDILEAYLMLASKRSLENTVL